MNYNYSSNIRVYCKPTSASVTPAGPTLLGEIESARLTIEGELVAATLRYTSETISALRSWKHMSSRRNRVFSDNRPRLTGFVLRRDQFPDFSWYFYVDYDLSSNGYGYMNSGDTIYCLRIAKMGYQEVFLALRPSPSTAGAYERIGLGRYIFSTGWEFGQRDNFPFEVCDYGNGVQHIYLQNSEEQFWRLQNGTEDHPGLFEGSERQTVTIL